MWKALCQHCLSFLQQPGKGDIPVPIRLVRKRRSNSDLAEVTQLWRDGPRIQTHVCDPPECLCSFRSILIPYTVLLLESGLLFPPTTISLLLEMHLRPKCSNSSRFVLKQSEVDKNAPNGFYNKDNAFKIQIFFLIIGSSLKQICKKTLHGWKLLLFSSQLRRCNCPN